MYNKYDYGMVCAQENFQDDDFMVDDSMDRVRFLDDKIKEFNEVSKNLSILKLKYESLTDEIISALGHDKEGQRTYEHHNFKIEVKTPATYSVDRKKYEQVSIPDEYNPIKQNITYAVNKELCDRFINDAPQHIKELLFTVIEKKQSRKTVTVKERI